MRVIENVSFGEKTLRQTASRKKQTNDCEIIGGRFCVLVRQKGVEKNELRYPCGKVKKFGKA